MTHHGQYLPRFQYLGRGINPLTPSTNTSASKYFPVLETYKVLQGSLDSYERVHESRIASSGSLSLGPESIRCNPSTAYHDLNHAEVLAYTRWGNRSSSGCLRRCHNNWMTECHDVLRDLLTGLPPVSPAKMTRFGSGMAISTLLFVPS